MTHAGIIKDVFIGVWIVGCFLVAGIISASTKKERGGMGWFDIFTCIILSWFSFGLLWKFHTDKEE